MATYKFKTLDDILRYPPPKTTPFKEIWHASQKEFGVRVMRPSKHEATRQTSEKPKVITLQQAFGNYLNLKKDTLSSATVEDC